MVIPIITPLYAALLGLLFLVLTVRVGMFRVKNSISIGDGKNDEMLHRIRAHANFTEYVPLALILILFTEILATDSTIVHALGAALLVGRVLHAYGLSSNIMRPRLIGQTLTMLSLLGGSICTAMAVYPFYF